MARPAPVRERILDAAHDLVLDRGFSATTVDAVLASAEASKGAFFHHFPSKHALGRALVERYAAGDRTLLEEHVRRAEAQTDDPGEQVIELVAAFEDAADETAFAQPGCLFVSFVYERVSDTDDIRALIAAAVDQWRARIADKLALARAARRLPEDVDIDALAHHVFTTFEGAFILARATDDPSHVRAQVGQLRRYLELLLAPS